LEDGNPDACDVWEWWYEKESHRIISAHLLEFGTSFLNCEINKIKHDLMSSLSLSPAPTKTKRAIPTPTTNQRFHHSQHTPTVHPLSSYL
jgi:hypothetical protein